MGRASGRNNADKVLALFKAHLITEQIHAVQQYRHRDFIEATHDKQKEKVVADHNSLATTTLGLDPIMRESVLKQVSLDLDKWRKGKLNGGDDLDRWARLQSFSFRSLLQRARQVEARSTTRQRLQPAPRDMVYELRKQRTARSTMRLLMRMFSDAEPPSDSTPLEPANSTKGA